MKDVLAANLSDFNVPVFSQTLEEKGCWLLSRAGKQVWSRKGVYRDKASTHLMTVTVRVWPYRFIVLTGDRQLNGGIAQR